jgi:flagellar biosynthesis anti-sigma factor FlgM
MKIDERKGVLDPRLGGPGAVRPEGGPPPPTGEAAPGDQVSLSRDARLLASLRSEVGTVDTVREGRVEGLQAALAAGQYHVDPADVAAKLLREVMGELVA